MRKILCFALFLIVPVPNVTDSSGMGQVQGERRRFGCRGDGIIPTQFSVLKTFQTNVVLKRFLSWYFTLDPFNFTYSERIIFAEFFFMVTSVKNTLVR